MKRVLLVGLVAIGLSVGGFGSPLARVTGAAPPSLEVVNLAVQAQADGTALYRVCVVSPETPIVGYIALSAGTSTTSGTSSVTVQQVALSESGYDCGLPYSYRLQGVAAFSPSGRATTYDFTQVCVSTPHHPLCLGREDNFTGQGGMAVPIIPNCSVDLQVNEDGQVVGPTALLGCRDGQGSLTNGQALPTPTPTPQSACNATSTPLAGATSTNTATPTDTSTPTNTATPTNTPTNTPIPTVPVFPGQPTPTPTLPRTEAVHRTAGANTASDDLAGLDAATTPTPIVLCLATPSATATTAVSPTNTAEPAASPAATATDTPQASAPTATDTPPASAPTATDTPSAPPATATDTPPVPPAPTATNTAAPPAPTATSVPQAPPPATATNTAPPPPAPTATNTAAPPPAPTATNTVAPQLLAPSATATTAPPPPSATPTGTAGLLAATATPTPSNAPPASPTSSTPPPPTIPVRQATPPSRVGHPLATRLRISVTPHVVRPGDTALVTIRYLRRASLHIVLAYAPHHHLALTRRANAKGVLSLRLRVPRVTLRGGHGTATMTVTATSGSSHATQSVRIALSDLVLSLATAKVRACGQVLTVHIAYFGAAKAQVTVSYLGRSHLQKTVRTGHGGLATSRLKLSYLHLKQRRLTLTFVVNGWHGRIKQTERMRVTVSVPAACLS